MHCISVHIKAHIKADSYLQRNSNLIVKTAFPFFQSCAIYKSAHCISCAENVDECNVDVLPFLVLNKCPSSHPALVESLQNACDVRAAATAAQARSLDSAAASAAPAALVLVAGLALSVLRGRDAHCG